MGYKEEKRKKIQVNMKKIQSKNKWTILGPTWSNIEKMESGWTVTEDSQSPSPQL
jgi:hypothetical protein